MVLHHFHSKTPSMPKVRFLEMDSPRRGNWAEYDFSEMSEHGFPPKGQLGGRRALRKKVRFLKIDSSRRGNWAEEKLVFSSSQK